MNLDIDCVIEIMFFHINMGICIGWDQMSFGVFLLLLFELVPK